MARWSPVGLAASTSARWPAVMSEFVGPACCGRRSVRVVVPCGASLQPVAATQVTAVAISQRCMVIHSPRNMSTEHSAMTAATQAVERCRRQGTASCHPECLRSSAARNCPDRRRAMRDAGADRGRMVPPNEGACPAIRAFYRACRAFCLTRRAICSTCRASGSALRAFCPAFRAICSAPRAIRSAFRVICPTRRARQLGVPDFLLDARSYLLGASGSSAGAPGFLSGMPRFLPGLPSCDLRSVVFCGRGCGVNTRRTFNPSARAPLSSMR